MKLILEFLLIQCTVVLLFISFMSAFNYPDWAYNGMYISIMILNIKYLLHKYNI